MSPGQAACPLQLLQLWSGGALPTQLCPITGLCWEATGLVGSSEGAALVLFWQRLLMPALGQKESLECVTGAWI